MHQLVSAPDGVAPWQVPRAGVDSATLAQRGPDAAPQLFAAPVLNARAGHQLGAGWAVPGAPCLLIEPGMGLGVTSLVCRADGTWHAHRHAGEQLCLVPQDAFQVAVLHALDALPGAATAQHVLSTAGLVQLYQAVCEVQGWTPGRPASATVRQAGVDGSDDGAEQALTMFCALLGSLAGRLAVDLAAQGGVALGGAIVPALGDWFGRSGFRASFEAQGRADLDLRPVPTWVMPGR
jgi:glucokinase